MNNFIADLVPVHLHTESKPVNLYTETKPGNLYTETRKKEDELVIKDLLEDIKESFESEFDLDLDHFSSEHESQFDDQVFFNLIPYQNHKFHFFMNI